MRGVLPFLKNILKPVAKSVLMSLVFMTAVDNST